MAWALLPNKVDLSLPTAKPHPFILRPDKTALVIVGMQKCIYDDPGSRAYATIEGNVRLLKKAREAGVKVIFTQNVRTPDGIQFTKYGQEPYMLEGSRETEIIDELTPQLGEPIIKHYTPDPFARTELGQLLLDMRMLPTDMTMIVTGVSAAVEAYTTCVGFSCRHYMTLIPMDCQAADSVQQEAAAFAKYRENTFAFTLSSMIEFSPAGMVTRDIVDALAHTHQ